MANQNNLLSHFLNPLNLLITASFLPRLYFSAATVRVQSCLFSAAAAVPDVCTGLVATVNLHYLHAASLFQ